MTEMNDPGSLARLARSLLASATDATLLLTAPVRGSEPTALLHDVDGAPQLWCERGSSAAAAARLRQPAVLRVVNRAEAPPHGSGAPVTLALLGRLSHVAVTDHGGRLVDVVALTPARVSLEVGRDPQVRTHVVPLDEYQRHSPDPVTAYASRLVAHTNAGQQRQLREYVIDRFGLPPSVVAGAMLTALDQHGATLRWVDAAGAHTTRLTFDRPATCPNDLALRLRHHLSAS
jgi:hypothetical protein